MTGPYDDIIHLPHHVSSVHPRMGMAERAAQFSPFAALAGHADALREAARTTAAKVELDEQAREELSQRLRELLDAREEPEVRITYFVPDATRGGGAYVTAQGRAAKFDAVRNALVMKDGLKIAVADILTID